MKAKLSIVSLNLAIALALVFGGGLASVQAAPAADETAGTIIYLPFIGKASIPGGRVVFSTKRSEGSGIRNWEIFAVNTDGTSQAVLTDENDGDDLYPTWSPDGTEVLFYSDRDGDWEIYVMDADGSDVDQLTDNDADDIFPSWSHDGNEIVFASDRGSGDDMDIYVMDSDGSDVENLTNNDVEDNQPVFSPDDNRIAFVSDRTDGEDMDLYLMDWDGDDQVRLTSDAGEETHPAWSPDGKWIAYESEINKNREIYVIRPDGTGKVNLTNNAAADSAPSWSPDSLWVIFSSDRSGNQNVDLFVMNTAGGDLKQITSNPAVSPSIANTHPSWKK